MWVILPNNADWDCFKTPILQEILRIQNLLQVEHCAFLDVIRLFQSVGCVRNKLQFRTVQQNQKSFISLDAGLRLDGIPALDLWDLIVAVLHGNTNQSHKEWGDPFMNKREVRSTPHTTHKRKKAHGMINDLDIVDSISSNVNSSRQALLYVFEGRQRSSDQDDHKGKKPDNETCIPNPQSCS